MALTGLDRAAGNIAGHLVDRPNNKGLTRAAQAIAANQARAVSRAGGGVGRDHKDRAVAGLESRVASLSLGSSAGERFRTQAPFGRTGKAYGYGKPGTTPMKRRRRQVPEVLPIPFNWRQPLPTPPGFGFGAAGGGEF